MISSRSADKSLGSHRAGGRITGHDQPDRGRDRGSAGIETPIAVGVLFMLVVFVVGGARIMTHRGEVDSAARAGARAAAAARTSDEAQPRAEAAVNAALGDSACAGPPAVSVIGWAPGSPVTVTVSCMTNMSGLRSLFGDDRVASAEAVEYVDLLRGESD